MSRPLREGSAFPRAGRLLLALLVAGCGLSPISHRIKIGEESFAVFVGEGVDHNTDLFTTTGSGGPVFQLTFTPVIERAPRLSRGGLMVAFLRMRDTLAATPREIVVMDLQQGTESSVRLPAAAGAPNDLAWARDGATVLVRSEHGFWEVPAPYRNGSARELTADQAAAADSALSKWLGDPPFTRAIACATGGVCAIGPHGDTTVLSPTGHDAMPWGRDSVAWFEGDAIVARSLGPGRAREIRLSAPPGHPRDGSYATVDSS